MTKFNLYKNWHKLEVCVVGKHYCPEWFSWVKDTDIRSQLEIVAWEIDQDLDKFIEQLVKFDVEILVPMRYLESHHTSSPMLPSCYPRNSFSVIDNQCFYNPIANFDFFEFYNNIKAPGWPRCDNFLDFKNLPDDIQQECIHFHKLYDHVNVNDQNWQNYTEIISYIESFQKEVIINNTPLNQFFIQPCPDLIITDTSNLNVEKKFPNCEIFYIPSKKSACDTPIADFIKKEFHHWTDLMDKNRHSIGILPIDSKNVIIDENNNDLIATLERHGITPHLVQFRHKDLWALNIHSCTAELSRRSES